MHTCLASDPLPPHHSLIAPPRAAFAPEGIVKGSVPSAKKGAKAMPVGAKALDDLRKLEMKVVVAEGKSQETVAKLTTALAEDKNVEALLKWLRGTLVKKELGDKLGVALLNKLITSLQLWGSCKVASMEEKALKAELDLAKEAYEASREVYAGAGAGAGAGASLGANQWAGDDE